MPDSFAPLDVLYREDELVAINKPGGLAVQPDKTGNESALSAVSQLCGRDAYVVHRIDRPVSGVVLFACSRKQAAAMSEILRDGKLEKLYWAVVDTAPPGESGTLENRIIADTRANKSRTIATEVAADRDTDRRGRHAVLEYTVVGKSDRYWMLEVRPKTGRHHQIRAQLAAIGCHIKGDVKYGARRTNPGGGIHLHARSVSFRHPITGAAVHIVAPPPTGDPLWRLLSEQAGG
ncbi:MAG TPA: RluA family pseudouridine synthase [Spirochaetia bacterium]|nr:RluA family pseudouridine synthase [Spirochaetia bacterium]